MSTTILKKKLDTIFSIYIRLKYADQDLNVKCFTCDKVYHYKKIQNGHFYSRAILSLRYDEQNCRPQCYGCNIAKSGNYIEYYKRLEKEIGKGGMDYLEYKRHQIKKMGKLDYQIYIDTYTQKVAEL
jgi:hypothetical protein